MKKRQPRTGIKSWCAASFAAGYDKPFLVIGLSLLRHPAFTGLKASSRVLYLTMALLCRGEPHFTFGRSWEKKYCGLAPKTATDSKRELEEKGFIVSQKSLHKLTEFAFCDFWKGAAAQGSGKKYTKPWLSASRDGAEKEVLIIGSSLMKCDQFRELSYSARLIYLAMAMEAGTNPRFMFPPAKAKEYGFTKSTLSRAERELENGHFIRRDPEALLIPGAYQFCYEWKRLATFQGKPINRGHEQLDPSKTEQGDFKFIPKVNRPGA